MVEGAWGVAAALAGSYLLGSIATGYWIGRLRGVDIRAHGSGNIGATNVLRVLGTATGVAVLAIDVAKGSAAVAWMTRLSPYAGDDFLRVGCGLAAVLGHTFPCWLGFRGGKGVATMYGVLLALAPFATVLAFLVLAAVVAATRYVSAGSLVSAVLFPVLIWLLGESGQGHVVLGLASLLAVAVVWRHRGNLRRIFAGTENRLGDTPPGRDGGRS